MTQVQLGNATGLSRQTISRAIASDEVSLQTETLIDEALSRIGARLGLTLRESAGGRILRSPQAWVRGTDLAQWSDRREAQHDLPAVIRSLVRLTAPDATRVSFRTGEGVQLGGWDGRVTATTATTIVPAGESGWEIGTSASITKKAQHDYTSRSTDPGDLNPSESSFVFVTSRRWAEKDEWVAARNAEGLWKRVLAYDADDLEAWLQDAPGVHLQLSRMIGAFPTGAQDLQYWWDNWSGATRPPLTPAFLLAGRADQAAAIQRGLAGSNGVIGVKSESREESIAIIASALSIMAEPDATDAFARSIVVEDGAAWRSLIASRSRLILIPTFDIGDAVSAAVRAGHVVALPLGEGDVETGNTVTVPPIARFEAATALKAAGLISKNGSSGDELASELASLARRSTTALRRRIGVATSLKRPNWARPEVARRLIPALLTTSWNAAIPGDRAFVERIAGKPYAELEDDLEQFTHGTDPALRRHNDIWYLVSRQDAWDSLGVFVRDEDVRRFRIEAVNVLSAVDPTFDIAREKRWMAGIYEKRSTYSHLLRSAIGESIALLGARADASERSRESIPRVGATSLHSVARDIARDVLDAANRDWRVWASLSSVLPDLAEAAPDVFLAALDEGLKLNPSPVVALLREEADGVFGGPSPHTGLLWALERLAWDPRRLSHVVQVLAELVRCDSGGKLANRPIATLLAIFRPWLPQTCASISQRFAVLDAMRDKGLVWEVLISTLPEFHAIAFHSASPRWQDWDADTPPVTQGEYETAITGAIARLLDLAGSDGKRWSALITALPNLGPNEREAIINRLARADVFTEDARLAIWKAMRDLVAQHRGFSGAKWAMAPEDVDRLDTLRVAFEPEDPIERYRWLFTWFPNLPDASASRVDDHDAYQQDIAKARDHAVRAVFSKLGEDALLRLAAASEQPGLVGDATATANLLEASEAKMLVELLASTEAYEDVFAVGYTIGKLRTAGTDWAKTRLQELHDRLTPAQQARILSVLEPTSETWSLAESFGPETERAYWQTVSVVRDSGLIERAVQKLVQFGRVDNAVQLLRMHAHTTTIPSHTILEVLNRVLAGEVETEGLTSGFGFDLSVLMDQLNRAKDVDKSEVARLEWGFLPVLEHSHSPIALHAALAEDPSLFVDLLRIVFRGENESSKSNEDSSESDRARASRAYSLLRSWRTLPGIAPDGSVDPKVLKSWVTQARALCHDADRVAIGDQQIGQMLSGAPFDADGTWPCAAVRDVIESIESDEMERGIAIGKFNSRGVVSRAIGEGGTQDHALADHYESLAAAVADSASRTARLLREMASDYRWHARREDDNAALDADLGR